VKINQWPAAVMRFFPGSVKPATGLPGEKLRGKISSKIPSGCYLEDPPFAESGPPAISRKSGNHDRLSFHTYKKFSSLAVATLRSPL